MKLIVANGSKVGVFKKRKLPVGMDSLLTQTSISFEDSYFKDLHYWVLTENSSLYKFPSLKNKLIISIHGRRELNILLEYIDPFSLIILYN